MNKARLSVITVCLNAKEALQRTISSVAGQTYTEVEYIVIDGGSTDGTLELIKSSEAITSYISEKDEGIYQAMNKGIAVARGEFLCFLNAGDYFVSEHSVRMFMEEVTKCEAGVYYGNIIWVDYSRNKSFIIRPNHIYDHHHLYDQNFQHPATIYRRSVFETAGYFDESYRISGDYDWNFKALVKFKTPWKYLDIVIAVFNADGLSNSPESQLLKQEENVRLKGTWLKTWETRLYSNRIFAGMCKSGLFRKVFRRIMGTRTKRIC